MEKKMTKVEMYERIANVVRESDVEDADVILGFLSTQVAQLNAKSEKAKARAAEKKAAGDELSNKIYEALTDDYQTIEEIAVVLADEPEITNAKISARLAKFVKAGTVEKESVRVESGKRMAYRLIAE